MNPFERRFQSAKDALYQLGPLLPGSVSQQWNVCGKPTCQCKDKKNPRKHGPYYQLSFTVNGKSSTMFIKPQDVEAVQACIERYQRFKKLNKDLVYAYVQWARNGGIGASKEEK